MKKLLILLTFLILTLTSTAQFYPKTCLVHKADTTHKMKGAPIFSVSVHKASISAVTLPVSVSEGIIQDSKLTIVNSLTIGGAYLFGAANVQVLQDSSVFVSGMTYMGITGAYGAASVLTSPKGSLVLGVIVGYEQFSLVPGYDLLNKYPVICLTYNLAGLPFLNSLTKINIK